MFVCGLFSPFTQPKSNQWTQLAVSTSVVLKDKKLHCCLFTGGKYSVNQLVVPIAFSLLSSIIQLCQNFSTSLSFTQHDSVSIPPQRRHAAQLTSEYHVPAEIMMILPSTHSHTQTHKHKLGNRNAEKEMGLLLNH